MGSMTVWEMFSPEAIDLLGYIPQIITSYDSRPVVEQVNDRYAHGGGWRKFEGFIWDRKKMTIAYPDDPDLKAIAKAAINPNETVYVFEHAWVLIDRGGDDWEIARLD